jgi:PTH1 family peptidyl-tRNA hydrolase
MGIGKPEHKGEVASYVLSDFSKSEQEHLSEWISVAAKAVESLLVSSLEDVSTKYTIKNFQLK